MKTSLWHEKVISYVLQKDYRACISKCSGTCRLSRPPLLSVGDDGAGGAHAQLVPDRHRHVVADHADSVQPRRLLLLRVRRRHRHPEVFGPVPVVGDGRGQLLLLWAWMLLLLLHVVETGGADRVPPRLGRVGVRRAEYLRVEVQKGEERQSEGEEEVGEGRGGAPCRGRPCPATPQVRGHSGEAVFDRTTTWTFRHKAEESKGYAEEPGGDAEEPAPGLVDFPVVVEGLGDGEVLVQPDEELRVHGHGRGHDQDHGEGGAH